MVLSQAREARLGWDNDFFVIPIASGHICWRNLFSFCSGFRDPNLVPETSRSRLNWFRHRNSTGVDYRQPVDDQSWYYRRIPGADL